MRWLRWWIAGYGALIGVVLVSMFAARERAITQWSAPKSVADWQAWREDVRQQQDQPQPVQRRVPKSGEPPALVLMRDHFLVSLVGALLFTGVLYWVIAWFVTGMLAGQGG